MSSMLSFVLKHVPEDWEEVDDYDTSYILFDLVKHGSEYEKVAALFEGTSTRLIKSIKRVQQPFQYGRFKLRQEMRRTHSTETAFHLIHPVDTKIALKHTCDYRRYQHPLRVYNTSYKKHPVFFGDVKDAMEIHDAFNEITVLVVCKIPGPCQTQSDYFIRYVVEIN